MIIRKMTAIRVMTRRTIITDPIIMAEITTAIQIQDQRIMVLPTTVLQMAETAHQMQ